MFDILVSKYLDGSLSAEEDRALRTILSENPIAKEQFNMAVSLHIAMKDEPEIDIDDKVLLATENAIFSSLRLEPPKSQPVTSHSLIKTKHRKTYAPRIAAFVRRSALNSCVNNRADAVWRLVTMGAAGS